MRFPWLQVDADFIGAHAADLGALLGVSRREAMGLALDLWTWALARAPDDAPPDGMISGTGPVPDRLLSGSVGWTGPVEVFSGALLACGLMVKVEAGYRLTGFDRYKATWEKNRRRTGGKPDRNRTGTGEEPARKTQTQTQTQKEEDLPPPSSAAPREGLRLEEQEPPRRTRKAKPEKPTDPRHAPLTQELCERLGWPHHGGRTGKAITELLRLADGMTLGTHPEGAPVEVLRRAAIAKAHEGFPRVRELHELVTHWGHFAEPQRRGTGPPDGLEPAAPDTCAGCGGRGQGGSVGEPEVWLGYECGCMGAWMRTQAEEKLHFTKAAEWAAQRRAA